MLSFVRLPIYGDAIRDMSRWCAGSLPCWLVHSSIDSLPFVISLCLFTHFSGLFLGTTNDDDKSESEFGVSVLSSISLSFGGPSFESP
ncbi:hypothetical protein BDN70DRAFT_674860 [Pholiota conissans]|uniref:Uncharacterized protein n=1 Tax=Pholiota conissans TaxID=109636 RepID=A0A9P5Z1J4_9AGAR|nr:hypothetical protein BDN70DRAFT_674860 [Pholiota conissans]